MVGTAGLGAAIAAALILLLDALRPSLGDHRCVRQRLPRPADGASFPTAVGLGTVAAAVTAAAPWLSRRWRRIGWALVIALALNHSSSPRPRSTRSAPCCAAGSPARPPSWYSAARPAGPRGHRLGRARQRRRAPRPAGAGQRRRSQLDALLRRCDRRPALFVKALGADQRSADLLFRMYRTLSRRQLGDERPFSSLRRTVEHEALVALAARDEGILTPRLVALATAEPNSFVLAYEAVEGRSLDRVAPDELTDPILADAWAQVSDLRRHRIAHRDLRLANIFLAAGGRIWLIDFGFSELAASDLLLRNDLAELVASSSLKVGPERAVAAAWAAVPADPLADAADRLRPWALSGATRTGLKLSPGLLDDLRPACRRLLPSPVEGCEQRADPVQSVGHDPPERLPGAVRRLSSDRGGRGATGYRSAPDTDAIGPGPAASRWNTADVGVDGTPASSAGEPSDALRRAVARGLGGRRRWPSSWASPAAAGRPLRRWLPPRSHRGPPAPGSSTAAPTSRTPSRLRAVARAVGRCAASALLDPSPRRTSSAGRS